MRRKGGRSTAGYGEDPDWADRGAGGTALRWRTEGGRGEAGQRARTERASVPKIARVNCHTLSLF